ncbi:MAG: sugar phosphate isomerase/epimerase family protein [Candidatus Hydrogenedentota bacterium]
MQKKNALTRRSFLGTLGKGGALAMGLSAGIGARAQHEQAAAGNNGPWQIGVYTRPWASEDYRTALDAIAEAGYDYVGLMSGVLDGESGLLITHQTSVETAQAIGEACEERGLAVPSLYGGGIPVAESLEAGVEAMRRLVDNCAAAGSTGLVMGGTGDPDLHDAYYEAIAETCDYAAEHNVGLSVKPHGGLNATGAQCRDIVNNVGHENFRVWYDPGNIFYYSDGELDPVDDAPDVDGLVAGMAVKDYVHPQDVNVTPGDGQVDFEAVMNRLWEGGFTGGPLIVETLASGTTEETIEEARKAREFLEELVAGLG